MLDRMKSSGEIFTVNCLLHVEQAVEDLLELQERLEKILCFSRLVIAQTAHVIDFILSEIRNFLDQIRLSGTSVYDVRDYYLLLRRRMADYISTFQVLFSPDYRSHLSFVNDFDFSACRNANFISALKTCDTLNQLSSLVDEHGGQVDLEDYLSLRDAYHGRFSLVRHLVRDSRLSHVAATRILGIVDPILQCFDHFSLRYVNGIGDDKALLRYIDSSARFVDLVQEMSSEEAYEFFQRREHLKATGNRGRSFTCG